MKLIFIITVLLIVASGCQVSNVPDIPTLIQKSELSLIQIYVVETGLDKKPSLIVCGTGFVVAPGMIATAAHILKDLPEGNKGAILLVPANQKKFGVQQNLAKVLASEPKHDIAILECPSLKNMPALMLHETSEVKIGEDALVLGFPFLDPTLTATKAMVAARSKRPVLDDDPNLMTDMFKLDASINMGNSGGPVIHIPSGKVIGVVSSKMGSISKQLHIFRKKEPNANMSIGGDDPIKLIKDTLNDMERNLQLGLGYGISVEYLRVLLRQVEQRPIKKEPKK